MNKFAKLLFVLMPIFLIGTTFAANPQNAPQAIFVKTAPVTLQNFGQQITLPGSLRAHQSIMLKPEVDGRITEVYFNSGDMVKAGTPLVQLNKSIVEAELRQSEAELELAKANYTRMSAMYKQHYISSNDFDAYTSKLKTAAANVDKYKAELDQTLIKAPFSGRLGLSAVNVGDYLTVGQDLVKLETINPIEVEFSVPEIYLDKLVVGENIKIVSDTFKDQEFTAKIYALDVTVNLSNRTIMVRAILPNPDGKLISGTFVKVLFSISQQKPSLTVPQIALFYDNNKTYVYKAVNNKALKTQVNVGQLDRENAEILDGLSIGDNIIIAGQMNLDDGMMITTKLEKH